MNLQQFRYVSEVARRNLNVSEAAEALHTSQPGVSKQIRALEEELGVDLFVRQGRRFVAITDAGREVLASIDHVLAELANMKSIGAEHADESKGHLAVAVTHTQARYALPAVVTAFKKRFANVKLKLLQGNPHQLARMVIDGEADVAIATEALDDYSELVTVPCYSWHHCVVVPEGHPLVKERRSRWRRSRSTRSSPTTRRSPAEPPSTRRSPLAGSSPRWRSPRSTQTSSSRT